MILVQITKTVKNYYTDEEIINILDEIGILKYTIEYINKPGIYIFVNNEIPTIIQLHADFNKGRNSAISQFITPTLEIINNHKNIRKILYLKENTNISKYNKLVINMLQTIGFEIINYKNIIRLTIDMIIEQKLNNFKRNNNASRVITTENGYIMYGKVDGANMGDTLLTLYTMRTITDKSIIFHIYNKTAKNIKIHKKSNDLMIKIGIIINTNNIEYITYSRYNEDVNKTARNQALFYDSLYNKYGEKVCYLCGFSHESFIWASHMKRVTDIDKEKIDMNIKIIQTTDPDNGLWLCVMHDKAFEKGIIWFDDNKLQISKHLSEKDKYLLTNNIIRYTIDKEHLTTNMINYLNLHKKRIGK